MNKIKFASSLLVTAFIGVLAAAENGLAAPIEVTGLNMFRDNRGINDVGIASGDRLQYGANVTGGADGTSLSGFYAPQGLNDPAAPCSPLLTNANFCSNSVNYANQNGIPRTAEPWTFTFTKPGETPLVVPGPSLPAGINDVVPHPTSVTISAGSTSTTPTISWQLPVGYVPDGFRIQIYDKDPTIARENGAANVIHTEALSATATSYTLRPGPLSSGRSLTENGNYSINFQVIETRGGVPFTGAQTSILSRSNSFFSFTPVPPGSPINVALPQVGEDPDPTDNRGAPFQFQVDSVGPSSVTFIDPTVAVGYDYATGVGNPNFASVIFPNVGDGLFQLLFGSSSVIVNALDEFFFPAGGVSAFSVRGIETGAGLDPTNVTAFITGLTFVSEGQFTGTMTPITQLVPDAIVPLPGSLALLALGIVGLGWSRRKK